jgi:hypothetical protein
MAFRFPTYEHLVVQNPFLLSLSSQSCGDIDALFFSHQDRGLRQEPLIHLANISSHINQNTVTF